MFFRHGISRSYEERVSQVLWAADPRFRKPFSRPFVSLLGLTQALNLDIDISTPVAGSSR